MKLPSPFVCDVCAKPKQEANHWFEAGVHMNQDMKQISVHRFTGSEMEGLFHLCGEACVTKKVSELLTGLAK